MAWPSGHRGCMRVAVRLCSGSSRPVIICRYRKGFPQSGKGWPVRCRCQHYLFFTACSHRGHATHSSSDARAFIAHVWMPVSLGCRICRSLVGEQAKILQAKDRQDGIRYSRCPRPPGSFRANPSLLHAPQLPRLLSYPEVTRPHRMLPEKSPPCSNVQAMRSAHLLDGAAPK